MTPTDTQIEIDDRTVRALHYMVPGAHQCIDIDPAGRVVAPEGGAVDVAGTIIAPASKAFEPRGYKGFLKFVSATRGRDTTRVERYRARDSVTGELRTCRRVELQPGDAWWEWMD